MNFSWHCFAKKASLHQDSKAEVSVTVVCDSVTPQKPSLSPGNLPNPGMEPGSPASLTHLSHQGSQPLRTANKVIKSNRFKWIITLWQFQISSFVFFWKIPYVMCHCVIYKTEIDSETSKTNLWFPVEEERKVRMLGLKDICNYA